MSSTTPKRWQELSPYLDDALTMTDAQRAVWLAALRQQDPGLAADLEALLQEHRVISEERFLEDQILEFPGATTPLLGQTVGAYTLKAPIGQGGMSTVWLAERNDGRFQGRAAIKFLNFAVSGPIGQARFEREGNVLGRFTHPHIARLMDAGVSQGGQPYLVLEHIEGEPIDQYCDRHKLDVEDRIRLFLDVVAAVAHAHSHLIVHRDIKPSNVLVTTDGDVKLLDFGIAKLLEEDQAATLTRAAGPLTPRFAAPEQLTNGDITTLTDIYSLGVLLYVLLSGFHPSGRNQQSAAELVQSITSLEPRRMSDMVSTKAEGDLTPHGPVTADRLRRQLRGDLDTIVAHALKKNPHERYPSATAFAADLRAYLAHEPISARPDTLAYRAAKFVRRNRLQVSLAAIAVVAALAGVAGTLVQARRARSERDFAFRQLARAEAIGNLQGYVLSDAAPSGKPFTVTDLLSRAEHIVERQHGDLATRVQLLISIGGQYTVADQYQKSRQLLEKAYALSKDVSDPTTRANAACKLAQVVSRSGDFVQAESLFHEGLAALPDDPLYLLSRADCWERAAEIAVNADRPNDAVARALTARELLAKSPIHSDEDDLGSIIVLASAYNMAGKRGEAIATYQRAAQRLQVLGRDDTQMAGSLYNNWGVTLIRAGQPLAAEAALRHSMDISRDGPGEDQITSTTLGNYAYALYLLGRSAEAKSYADRALAKATASGDKMAANFALMHRSRIYRALGDYRASRQMLAELSSRAGSQFHPGTLVYAVITAEQANTAAAAGDLKAADTLIDEALQTMDVLTRNGGAPQEYQSKMLAQRSDIELQLGRVDDAVNDASRATRLAEVVAVPGQGSADLGHAYLVLGRAYKTQGSPQAQAAFRSAAQNLSATLGSSHPEAVEAQRLAGITQ